MPGFNVYLCNASLSLHVTVTYSHEAHTLPLLLPNLINWTSFTLCCRGPVRDNPSWQYKICVWVFTWKWKSTSSQAGLLLRRKSCLSACRLACLFMVFQYRKLEYSVVGTICRRHSHIVTRCVCLTFPKWLIYIIWPSLNHAYAGSKWLVYVPCIFKPTAYFAGVIRKCWWLHYRESSCGARVRWEVGLLWRI